MICVCLGRAHYHKLTSIFKYNVTNMSITVHFFYNMYLYVAMFQLLNRYNLRSHNNYTRREIINLTMNE